jgi:riboflavin synthase
MFTGIITDIGHVVAIEQRGDTRFTIRTTYDTNSIAVGASISHNGVCLTVVEVGDSCYTTDVSAETLARTTLSFWSTGTMINLERSLRLGDELGGHLVYGHVDGIGKLIERHHVGNSLHFFIEVPSSLAPFIAPKGSIAIDGVSLTINEVDGNQFGINIIPHTQACTTFQSLAPYDLVNLEIDMLARYVAKLLTVSGQT